MYIMNVTIDEGPGPMRRQTLWTRFHTWFTDTRWPILGLGMSPLDWAFITVMSLDMCSLVLSCHKLFNNITTTVSMACACFLLVYWLLLVKWYANSDYLRFSN